MDEPCLMRPASRKTVAWSLATSNYQGFRIPKARMQPRQGGEVGISNVDTREAPSAARYSPV